MSKHHLFCEQDTEELISPKDLKLQLPASQQQLDFIYKSRQTIVDILKGRDPRLLLVVGPCSIHDIISAKEYAERLTGLIESIGDVFFVVMRTYFEKPRTVFGWKGLLYDPHLNGSHDIETGLQIARELLLWLAEMNIPAGTEFLDPLTPRYFGDLISWACIGARTTESQTHRQCASGLPMPVAFKNSTSGNIDPAINAMLSAANPHTFFGMNDTGKASIVRTKGNPYAHLVLRGGEARPNYDSLSINRAIQHMQSVNLIPRIMIDCSHDNVNSHYEEQTGVFRSVIQQYIEGIKEICGLSLESHLFGGNQSMPRHGDKLHYAVSLTDPCLDWEATEELVRWGGRLLKEKMAVLSAV